MHKKYQGFTIVELLIVIVIIAILAAVVIVAYTGIQQRAYNAQIVSGVDQFRKSIEMYKELEGHYPVTTPEENGNFIAVVCLGTGYPDEYCGEVTGEHIYEDPDFNAELTRVVGSGGAVSIRSNTIGPESFTGAVYGIDRIGLEGIGRGPGEIHARTIQYALEGGSNCVLSGAIAYNIDGAPSVTGCIIVLEDTPDYR